MENDETFWLSLCHYCIQNHSAPLIDKEFSECLNIFSFSVFSVFLCLSCRDLFTYFCKSHSILFLFLYKLVFIIKVVGIGKINLLICDFWYGGGGYLSLWVYFVHKSQIVLWRFGESCPCVSYISQI